MEQAGRGNRRRRAASALVVGLLAALAAAGCTRGDAAPRGTLVAVHEWDFKLTTTRVLVPAGLVTFRIHNTGPSTHELNVDRTDIAADALPLRGDGLSVNEDSKRLTNIGGLDDIRMDTTRELTLRLSPGHYVLYCNLEGHYLGGMYAIVQVQ
ncbi:MAG TPA: hypothetical protein VH914_08105 [Acidimicrobiia bacterium]|nr:hypothetical protein [Acidimicrobiia bacterium]